MFAHRFRDHLRTPSTDLEIGVGPACAFVPCPVFHQFNATQQTQIQDIYRIAAERTQEQLRRESIRRPQFSLN
jgi:hypothetical protein